MHVTVRAWLPVDDSACALLAPRRSRAQGSAVPLALITPVKIPPAKDEDTLEDSEARAICPEVMSYRVCARVCCVLKVSRPDVCRHGYIYQAGPALSKRRY